MSSVLPKRRWTRAEKRQRQAEEKDEDNPKTKLQAIKEPVSFAERLLQCATKIASTPAHASIRLPLTNGGSVDVKTCTNVSATMTKFPSIAVKPLLILDLNGILCHRIRVNRQDLLPDVPYRPAVDRIANTDIISRPNVEEFLHFLDAHFCLAVWTSAKPKTAKQLLKVIFPAPMQEKMLFCWSQSKCQAIRSVNEDVIFVKSLTKVWDEFPLWNDSNTFLMDDSPEKCPEHKGNTLHPPSLHGKRHRELLNFMSDEENTELQIQFFIQVAQYYVEPRQAWPNGDTNGLFEFLSRTAKNHMGWRGDE